MLPSATVNVDGAGYSKILVNFEHITWYHTMESSCYSLVCKYKITRIMLLFLTEKMASAMFC